MLLLALLACSHPWEIDPETGVSIDSGASDSGSPDSGSPDSGADTGDTGGPDDTSDTGETPAWEPFAVFAAGAFTWFEDGTVGTAWTHQTPWPAVVRVQVVSEEWLVGAGDSCIVSLTAAEDAEIPGQTWSFTDTWLQDTDGDGVEETVTADSTAHGFLAPGDALVASDCPPGVEATVAAASWGIGVGPLRPDVSALLVEAEVDPTGFHGGGIGGDAVAALLGPPGYSAMDFGFAFAIEADGQIARDEHGTGIRLDPALVGEEVPPPGYYQVLAAIGLEWTALSDGEE